MYQTHNNDEQPSTTQALPAVFAHQEIAALYEQGFYSNRVEAELADMLYQSDLDASAHAQEEVESAPIAVTDTRQLTALNGIALIQDGHVLPILNLAQMPFPQRLQDRVRLYHQAAQTLLEAVAAVLEERTMPYGRTSLEESNLDLQSCIRVPDVREGIPGHPELRLVALVEEGQVIPIVEANDEQEEHSKQEE